MTWEIPTLCLAAAVFLIGASPLMVQGLWCLSVTGRFAWPPDAVSALLGLTRGRSGVGLTSADAGALPGIGMLASATVVADIAVLTVIAKTLLVLTDLANPSGHDGLATRRHASRALGVTRLRRAAPVIRPDQFARVSRRALPTAIRNRRRMPANEYGWYVGRAGRRGPELWIPYDRTSLIVGPQGSGKTLDLLVPALLGAPGSALVTLTKPEDLFLTLPTRRHHGPVVVLDPFRLAGNVPELIWDPIAGCADPAVAERRAKAFAAGTIRSSSSQDGDHAARFYAGECAKVLQAYFHAADLAELTLDDVLRWVANPRQHLRPEEILRTHPDAEPHWDGLLRGALFGDSRTAGNTVTTLQQAMALFFQTSVRERCVPGPGRPPSDLVELIEAGATFYLLGRDDPYASAAPLMTAITEHILDTAKRLGETSPHGRLCPPFLACLDELPSTAPIPTLATRMANERALGVSFILAAQTWRQLVVCYGEDEARTILGLSNNLVAFGGGKDIQFYQELADLIGATTVVETRHSRRNGISFIDTSDTSWGASRVPILEASEIRRLPERRALLLSETTQPLVAHLRRSLDGRAGARLRAARDAARLAARTSPSGPRRPGGRQ